MDTGEIRKRFQGQRQDPAPARVVVTDLDIPFTSLVWLLVKVALALIPAILILIIIGVAARNALRLLGL